MASSISIADHFKSVTLDGFVRYYFSKEFDNAIKEITDLKERAILEEKDSEDRLFRRIRYVPNRNLPEIVKKFLGGKDLSYVETMTYFKKEFRLDWESRPEVLSEKIRSWGTVTFLEKDGGITRKIDGKIEVKIFGVGGMIEKIVVGDIEGSFRKLSNHIHSVFKGV